MRSELKCEIKELILGQSRSAFVLLTSIASEASEEFLGFLFTLDKSITSGFSGSLVLEWISHGERSPDALILDRETDEASGNWRLPVFLGAAERTTFLCVDQPRDLFVLTLVE
jgi:hypothetical protein